MTSQEVDHGLAVLHPAACVNLLPEHGLLAVVVHKRSKDKLSTLTRTINSPARQTARDFLHILLGVASFDTKRVKLHDLTRVVLVDTRLAALKRLHLSLPIHLIRILFAFALHLDLATAIVRIVVAPKPRITETTARA